MRHLVETSSNRPTRWRAAELVIDHDVRPGMPSRPASTKNCSPSCVGTMPASASRAPSAWMFRVAEAPAANRSAAGREMARDRTWRRSVRRNFDLRHRRRAMHDAVCAQRGNPVAAVDPAHPATRHQRFATAAASCAVTITRSMRFSTGSLLDACRFDSSRAPAPPPDPR